jgi:hypothetical protein
MMAQSRRPSTNKLYGTHIQNYLNWTTSSGVDPFAPDIKIPLNYLDFLRTTSYHKGGKDLYRGYSAINTVRSALSSILHYDGKSFGDHHFTVQYMKGMENSSPPCPRYLAQWDPELVLELFKSTPFDSATKLELPLLAKKTLMLILLATGKRHHLIANLSMAEDRLTMGNDSVVFKTRQQDFKQGSKSSFTKPAPLILNRFKDDHRIDPVHNLKIYLKRTKSLRNGTMTLFLISKKPFGAASVDTLRRWVTDILLLAKIDLNLFKPGSTRGASTSKGSALGASLDEILNAGGWRQSSTFVKWYKRPVSVIPRQLGDIIFS